MIVNTEHLDQMLEQLDKINSTPLEDIMWMGTPTSAEDIAEWKFIGLSNLDFYKYIVKRNEYRTKRARN